MKTKVQFIFIILFCFMFTLLFFGCFGKETSLMPKGLSGKNTLEYAEGIPWYGFIIGFVILILTLFGIIIIFLWATGNLSPTKAFRLFDRVK